jgi:hypothetical protein
MVLTRLSHSGYIQNWVVASVCLSDDLVRRLPGRASFLKSGVSMQGSTATGTSPVATHAVVADDLSDKQRSTLIARVNLVIVGVCILAWMIIALILANTRGSEKHVGAPGTTVTTSATTTTTPAAATAPATNTTRSTTSTTGAKTDESNTSAPSDTVLVALLTIGGILVLSGALYTRLSTVKLGTGFEVTLSPEQAADVAGSVNDKAPAGASQQDITRATAAALEVARSTKRVSQTPLDVDAIEHAAVEGLKVVGLAPPPAHDAAAQRQ